MSKSVSAVLVGVLVFASAGGSALGANRKAREMVASLKKGQTALLMKVPTLGQVDAVIRADCAAQNKGQLATDAFCGCAAAVTMGLWRSGMDPKMIPRLNDYSSNPTEVGAKEFLKYQGPELYRGVCSEASKR